MKRLILLICMLALTLDLAQDGFLGKAEKVTPHTPEKSLTASPLYIDTGNLNFGDEPLPATISGIRHHSPSQLVTPVAQHPLKLLNFFQLGSSGGIPR